MAYDSTVLGRCWIPETCIPRFWTFGLWATEWFRLGCSVGSYVSFPCFISQP